MESVVVVVAVVSPLDVAGAGASDDDRPSTAEETVTDEVEGVAAAIAKLLLGPGALPLGTPVGALLAPLIGSCCCMATS